jgi:ribosomal protein S8E
MTSRRGGAFDTGDPGTTAHGRKEQKRGKAGRKDRGTRKRRTEHLLEQPIAETIGTVRCEICRHLVDPKRLHIHMVRFHGAELRPGKP